MHYGIWFECVVHKITDIESMKIRVDVGIRVKLPLRARVRVETRAKRIGASQG